MKFAFEQHLPEVLALLQRSKGASFLLLRSAARFMLKLEFLIFYLYKLWNAIVYMCRYINSNRNELTIIKKVEAQCALTLTVFVDASYAPRWSPKAKSVSCVIIFLGSTLIVFEVKAQSVVAQSSTEAEIIAMALAVRRDGALHCRLPR